MKTAAMIGATGLVGSHLLDLLIKNNQFDQVKVFTRRTTGIKADKLQEFLIDFDKPDEWNSDVNGDVLFSALGTTIKKAGSQTDQYKIDFTYQYTFAQIAAKNGTGCFVLVSSAGADPKSKIFYSRMKGELEEAVKNLPFQKIRIIQPGILDGERKESRPMEKFAITVAKGLNYIPGIGKYRPVHAGIVARAMINSASIDKKGVLCFTLEEVFSLAEQKTSM